MTYRLRLSLVPAIALGSLMLLGGCSSYTTGYYPGRHYGDGVRQHYTNDAGNNIGYTINTRNTGSRADPPRYPASTGSAVHYNRAPLARGGYSYSPGVYTAGVSDVTYSRVSVGYTTLGRRHYRHHRGHYGFGHGGYDTYSYGGFGYASGFGFGFHSGYHGGAYGGHYGGHYAGHGSHHGHHGSHSGHGHGHGGGGGAPAPDPAP